MNAKLVNSAAGVIMAALQQNRTAAGIALALDSAQLLMTPETAAELERLRARVAELEAERHTTNEALDDAVQALRANRDEPKTHPIRKHHPDCAAVHQAGAPCTCPPEFTGEDPDLIDEDGDGEGCTCPDTGRGEPHDVDCPLVDAPGPYDAVAPEEGPDSAEMRELRASLCGGSAVDGITRRNVPLQALREDPHDGPLHHDWRLGRDLPETGGAQ